MKCAGGEFSELSEPLVAVVEVLPPPLEAKLLAHGSFPRARITPWMDLIS